MQNFVPRTFNPNEAEDICTKHVYLNVNANQLLEKPQNIMPSDRKRMFYNNVPVTRKSN